jgi:GH18 family chitinase
MRVFGQLLLVDKQKVPYLYKTTSKELILWENSKENSVEPKKNYYE